MSEMSNIFYERDNRRFNERGVFLKYNDDHSEIKDENFKHNSELESDNESEILLEFQRHKRHLSSSDSECFVKNC